MANNPFQTPTGTLWTLPPATLGTLFNTSARVTRLQTRWANPTLVPANGSIFTNLKNTWNSSSVAAANTGFGHALKYLATGNSAEATSAYTQALSESAAASPFETDNPRMWAYSAAYVYAWCNGALSASQNAALIARIESNNATLETGLAGLGNFLIDGPGNGGSKVGIAGYVFGCIAIQGASGATDRRTNLRNLVQNMSQLLDETGSEGYWMSYDFLAMQVVSCILAYHIATGEENLVTTRCRFIANRGEMLWRMLSGDLNTSYILKAKNARLGSGCKQTSDTAPEDTWSCAMQSDITRDPLMTSMRENLIAHGSPTQWTKLQIASTSTWAGFLFYDDALTAGAQTPTQAGTALCKSFPVVGISDMRASWNSSTALSCWFSAGPTSSSDHDKISAGALYIKSGSTILIWDGYTYGHSPSNWETLAPIGTNEVAGYTMVRSCPSFSPTATQATREDRDGSANNSISGVFGISAAAYPLSGSLTNNVRQTWATGSLGTMFDDGVLAKVTGDISQAYRQVTSAKRTVGYRRGASVDKGTIVVYDQFNAPATIGNIRANFWSKVKPIQSGTETVLQGGTTAGVVKWTGTDRVVIRNGSYQATIQIVTPFSNIHGVGGFGYESFFDGYNSGGSNLDFIANANTNETRITTEFNSVMKGQWRTSFQTTQSTALGEMLFVITVDATGTTAPTYTKAQALALLTPDAPPTGGPTMPGLTQAGQRQTLDYYLGTADPGLPVLWAGLFTTVPADDGTGGTEVSGTAYARVACPAGTFANASGGSPATTSNASIIRFPQALSNWASGNTLLGWGLFKASSGGTAWFADYLGTDSWDEFTCTSASPGVLTRPGHGYTNGDKVVVTSKYGVGSLPTTAGSWNGPLTVANVTTDTFTLGVNTSATGNGMCRKIVPGSIITNDTYQFDIGALTITQG